MDLRQLRYFAQVVESGSFSRAAGVLHIAQPALSQHVRHMEEELGLSLLHRGPQGVKATEAGLRLMKHAKTIIAEFAEIPDSVRGLAVAPRGDVRFGLPGTVGELLAAPLIEAARTLYPDVRIRVVEAMSGYIMEWLKRGEVDLAMVYSTSDPRGIAVHHALSEEICLFASAEKAGEVGATGASGTTVRLADIAGLPLILPGQGHGLRELVDDAASAIEVALTPSIEIDSYGQIKKLVSRGLGFGLLPRMAIAGDLEAGTMRAWRFEDPQITRKVYLAYSRERPLPTAQRVIGQLSWEILQQLVRDDIWTASPPEPDQRPALFP